MTVMNPLIKKPEIKKPQMFDYKAPNPKIPPKTIGNSIRGDMRCSSPECPNYCTRRCGFCKFHCQKWHSGEHYR